MPLFLEKSGAKNFRLQKNGLKGVLFHWRNWNSSRFAGSNSNSFRAFARTSFSRRPFFRCRWKDNNKNRQSALKKWRWSGFIPTSNCGLESVISDKPVCLLRNYLPLFLEKSGAKNLGCRKISWNGPSLSEGLKLVPLRGPQTSVLLAVRSAPISETEIFPMPAEKNQRNKKGKQWSRSGFIPTSNSGTR